MWFAWKIVLLQYHKHRHTAVRRCRSCCDLLEKSYFCSITNIVLNEIRHQFRLWFAWKIVLLQYHKHRVNLNPNEWKGCDLLEKSYFCSITNIPDGIASICAPLWFAWKIVLLQYHKHRVFEHGHGRRRCDLLEKSYFCSITNIVR